MTISCVESATKVKVSIVSGVNTYTIAGAMFNSFYWEPVRKNGKEFLSWRFAEVLLKDGKVCDFVLFEAEDYDIARLLEKVNSMPFEEGLVYVVNTCKPNY